MRLEVIYDIGANEGKWSQYGRELLRGKPDFFLFEPNDSFNLHYQEMGFYNYYNVLLSDSNRTVDFYSVSATGDSYYRELGNPIYAHVVPQKKLTVSLDSFRKEHGLPQPQFIKIDTQGAELDVLAGSVETLRDTLCVLLECPIVDYNEGAPPIQNYLDFMKDRGFVPIELTEVHIVSKILVQVDIAFLRKDYLNLLCVE